MSSVDTRDALEAALDAMTPLLDTAHENEDYEPTEGRPYQKSNLLLSDPVSAGYGSAYVEQGIFQVTLFYPKSTGPNAADERAELIRATFARSQSFTSGGSTVRINKTPTIDAGSVDGDRWMVPVKIIFFCNSIGV